MIFINVKTLIMFMLLSEQARERPVARGHHVGDSWPMLYFQMALRGQKSREPLSVLAQTPDTETAFTFTSGGTSQLCYVFIHREAR